MRAASRAAIALLLAIGVMVDQAAAQNVGPPPAPAPSRPFYPGGGRGMGGLGLGLGLGLGALAVGAIASQSSARGAPSMIETPPDGGGPTFRTYHPSQGAYLPPPPSGHGFHKPRPHKVVRLAQTPPTNPPPSNGPTPPPFPTGFVVPARTELRYVPNEVLVITRGDVAGRLKSIEGRLGLTSLASAHINLIDVDVHRYQLPTGAVVGQTVASLRGQGAVLGAEPNYLFELQDDAAKPAEAGPAPEAKNEPEAPVQYAVTSLRLDAAHRVAMGNDVLVAVIDSGIDESNPDLHGAIASRFDAIGGAFAPQEHGTAMGGAIVAHHTLVGAAPKARLLAIRAFTGGKQSANGTGYDILRGLDYAASNGARIVNMSFAGPRDALLEQAIVAAHAKGMVLFAAAGNGGPTAKPLFPGAGPDVIAVTAADADGKPFAQANRGSYIAVAAPGVNVVAPGLGDGVRLSSGTSIATAEASGVAALILQKRTKATPDEIRRILMSTARPLSSEPAAGGAGLIDAAAAVATIN